MLDGEVLKRLGQLLLLLTLTAAVSASRYKPTCESSISAPSTLCLHTATTTAFADRLTLHTVVQPEAAVLVHAAWLGVDGPP